MEKCVYLFPQVLILDFLNDSKQTLVQKASLQLRYYVLDFILSLRWERPYQIGCFGSGSDDQDRAPQVTQQSSVGTVWGGCRRVSERILDMRVKVSRLVVLVATAAVCSMI